MHMMLLNTDSPIITSMNKTGRAAEPKGKSTASSSVLPGAPHHNVWGALILALLQAPAPANAASASQEDMNVYKADMPILNQHATAVVSAQQLQDVVHVCRVGRAYKESTSKVQVSVDHELTPVLARVLRQCLTQGAQLMHGPPPPSSMQRELPTELERITQ